MSETSRRIFSLADFLVWESEQERRFELVDGEAVMMAGGTQAHALIAANIVSALRSRLRGSSCRPSGSDMRVPIPATGNSRYPDVTVDCGRYDPTSNDASEPVILFEVLSDSTGWYDQARKLRDYDNVPSVRQYVCVSQSECCVPVWERDALGRLVPEDVLLDGSLSLALQDGPADLPLAEIYEDAGLLQGSGSHAV
ncbi:Uma2 family endonuclease [Aureimonas mangrovi]|uniref:Uma2 family endonuclease n=1 Tax=Aureimonas mangrovi TaxID=2758041 RepID=UPI001FEB2B6C|nr:Uma2 family endonuclease [Aureimonas mangrovi]